MQLRSIHVDQKRSHDFENPDVTTDVFGEIKQPHPHALLPEGGEFQIF